MLNLLIVFFEFFKAGLFAVGGGLATLPFLKAMVGHYPWFTASELTNMIAISESTPGPMGVNMATFAGFNAGGVVGALTATIGLVTPSVIIIICVSRILEKFRNSKLVKNAFHGLRPASSGLIMGAMFDVFLMAMFHMENWGKDMKHFFNIPSIIIFVATFAAIKKFDKAHPLYFILIGAVLGVILGL
ncbi:MAG: chromate transporter [Lachnospiraceae bacterium]|nr:chromate transporter [Lachnospiraceae bacterium]